MKKVNNYQTTAVKRAARGMLNNDDYSTIRTSTVYGFNNHALQLSSAELKNAWKKASSSIKNSRG